MLSKKVKSDIFAKFLATLKQKDRVLIIMHRSPDPDAIASASAIAACLAEVHEIKVDIIYSGQISHPQNRAMVNILNLPVKKVEVIEDLDTYDATILIDCSRVQINIAKISKNVEEEHREVEEIDLVPTLIIDHHDVTPLDGVRFTIKHSVGACASIVTALVGPMLEDQNLDEEFKQRIATALALGIRTDTGEFTNNVSSLDQDAFCLLMDKIDWNLMVQIMNHSIPSLLLTAKAAAYKDWFRKQETTIVTGVGVLKPENRDFLAIIADELIRCEGIDKVVVMGMIDGSLVASVRNITVTTNTIDFCHRVFGKMASGAKHGAGGAFLKIKLTAGEIPITTMSEDYYTKLFAIIFDDFCERVFREQGK